MAQLRSANMPLWGRFLPFGLAVFGDSIRIVDGWISAGQNEKKAAGRSQRKGTRKKYEKKKSRK